MGIIQATNSIFRIATAVIVAFTFSAAANVVQADDSPTVVLMDPTSNSTIPLPMMQMSYKVKFKINDDAYSYSTVKLLKDTGNGTFVEVAEADNHQHFNDENGQYTHSEATFDMVYPSGPGYKIVVWVFRIIPVNQPIFAQDKAENLTFTRN